MKGLLSGLALTVNLLGQNLIGLTGPGDGTSFNQEVLVQRDSAVKRSDRNNVVVFSGDRVIPQFVDGSSWKTTIFLVNLENYAVTFDVLFFKDNGTDLYVPVVGLGSVRGVHVILAPTESLYFETAGESAGLAQGWALLSKGVSDSVGGMAIFRQSVPGRNDQEAVVPIVNQFDSHFVMMFDNTAFTSAIALANPTVTTVVIPVNIRAMSGEIIDRRTLQLGAYSHTAFTLPDTWTSTAGRRGVIEFLTSGFGVGALGLRFNGSAFTSFHVLSNYDWMVP